MKLHLDSLVQRTLLRIIEEYDPGKPPEGPKVRLALLVELWLVFVGVSPPVVLKMAREREKRK